MNGNNALVKIMGKEVSRIEYRNEPVITFRMMDELHERPEGTAKRNFNQNQEKFIEGEDFFEVPFSEWSLITAVRNSYGGQDTGQRNPMKFLTQTGYLMLVKSFTDDLAWQVQRELVKCYFAVKQYKEQFKTVTDEMLARSEEVRKECRIADNIIKAQRTAEVIAGQVFIGNARPEEFPVSEEVMKYVHRYLEAMQKKQMYTSETKNGYVHPGLLKFWHSLLSEDRLPGHDAGMGSCIEPIELYEMYRVFAKKNSIRGSKLSFHGLGKQLKRICPFLKRQRGSVPPRKYRYTFPSLEICRQSFIETLGHAVEFDRKNAGEIRGNA